MVALKSEMKKGRHFFMAEEKKVNNYLTRFAVKTVN